MPPEPATVITDPDGRPLSIAEGPAPQPQKSQKHKGRLGVRMKAIVRTLALWNRHKTTRNNSTQDEMNIAARLQQANNVVLRFAEAVGAVKSDEHLTADTRPAAVQKIEELGTEGIYYKVTLALQIPKCGKQFRLDPGQHVRITTGTGNNQIGRCFSPIFYEGNQVTIFVIRKIKDRDPFAQALLSSNNDSPLFTVTWPVGEVRYAPQPNPGTVLYVVNIKGLPSVLRMIHTAIADPTDYADHLLVLCCDHILKAPFLGDLRILSDTFSEKFRVVVVTRLLHTLPSRSGSTASSSSTGRASSGSSTNTCGALSAFSSLMVRNPMSGAAPSAFLFDPIRSSYRLISGTLTESLLLSQMKHQKGGIEEDGQGTSHSAAVADAPSSIDVALPLCVWLAGSGQFLLDALHIVENCGFPLSSMQILWKEHLVDIATLKKSLCKGLQQSKAT